MALHIVKLCVGAESVEDLAQWQANFERPVCGTRTRPKRDGEVLDGGSLYWVIKGLICVRQRIIEIGDVVDGHGPRVGLYLERDLIRTVPQPRRAFQGWRYLVAADAPKDLVAALDGNLPDDLRLRLAEIGVI